jgi:hypothetical protein
MQIQQRKDGYITIHEDGTNQSCPFASTADGAEPDSLHILCFDNDKQVNRTKEKSSSDVTRYSKILKLHRAIITPPQPVHSVYKSWVGLAALPLPFQARTGRH